MQYTTDYNTVMNTRQLSTMSTIMANIFTFTVATQHWGIRTFTDQMQHLYWLVYSHLYKLLNNANIYQ